MAEDVTDTTQAAPYDFITGESRVAARIDRLRDAINRAPLFRDIAGDQVELIGRLASDSTIAPEQVLVRQGEPGEEFVVLMEGTARVERSGRVIDHLKPGDYFGEMSILDGRPRSATIVAESPGSILVLQKHAFDHLRKSMPDLSERIILTLCSRLRALQENLID